MQSPILEVDAHTYQQIENYVNEWTLFFQQSLSNYNISSDSADKPEWFRNLEFSSEQKKYVLCMLMAGIHVKS